MRDCNKVFAEKSMSVVPCLNVAEPMLSYAWLMRRCTEDSKTSTAMFVVENCPISGGGAGRGSNRYVEGKAFLKASEA